MYNITLFYIYDILHQVKVINYSLLFRTALGDPTLAALTVTNNIHYSVSVQYVAVAVTSLTGQRRPPTLQIVPDNTNKAAWLPAAALYGFPSGQRDGT